MSRVQFFTPEQVAERWQIPVKTVRQMCRRRELGTKIGRHWRIDPDEIKRIEEKGKAA